MARRFEDDDEDDDRDDEDEEEDEERPRKSKKPTDEEKQMAMFCHLGALLGGFLIPLIIWMMKKDQSRFIDRHGKEALNFNISFIIWYMVIGMVTCGIGALVLFPLFLWWCIAAGMEANRGGFYEYPMTIRFIK